jgi:hypothetical protein
MVFENWIFEHRSKNWVIARLDLIFIIESGYVSTQTVGNEFAGRNKMSIQ